MGPNPQETADLVTFTEEILNGNFYFLRSVSSMTQERLSQTFSLESN